MFIVNYKAYKLGIDKGEEIAKYLKKKIKDSYVCPPQSKLHSISKIIGTFAQHIDPVEPGAFTGHITWYDIKKAGAIGSLINHSEDRIKIDKIEKLVKMLREHGMKSIVCVKNVKEAEKVARFDPYAIAYEPPKLIGGNISVSTAQPKIVKEFVEIVKLHSDSIPIIGAGIKSSEDIIIGKEEGAEGFLVASGVVNENYKKAIDEFSKAFN